LKRKARAATRDEAVKLLIAEGSVSESLKRKREDPEVGGSNKKSKKKKQKKPKDKKKFE